MAAITTDNDPVIYIIDPDPTIRAELVALFERIGFDALSYDSAEDFLAVEQNPIRQGCIVSEMKLPGAGGLELLGALRDRHSRLPFVILTGDPDVGNAVAALHSKVADYLVKPVIERELIKRIKVALRSNGSPHGSKGVAQPG